MTSSYAGKVYRMNCASVSGALGTPLCDQLIEVDKIELRLLCSDNGVSYFTFSHPRPGCFGAVISFEGFKSFRIGNICASTLGADILTYNLLSFLGKEGLDSVKKYPANIESFNSCASIDKSLFDRLVAAGLFVEESEQKADDHKGMVYNPFTNSWSFGFCG